MSSKKKRCLDDFKGCVHCSGLDELRQRVENYHDDVFAFVFDNEYSFLSVHIISEDVADKDAPVVYCNRIGIKFCPMCGRKLLGADISTFYATHDPKGKVSCPAIALDVICLTPSGTAEEKDAVIREMMERGKNDKSTFLLPPDDSDLLAVKTDLPWYNDKDSQ